MIANDLELREPPAHRRACQARVLRSTKMDRRKAILVSRGEHGTMADLRAVAAKHGLDVHVKMRLADVVAIDNSSLTPAEFGFALRCHVDFVVSRENRALFGIEFDGAQHDHDADARRRDDLKDAVALKLGLPLLRIGSDLPGQRLGASSVVEVLIEAFLYGEALDEFQDAGGAPDEYLDPLDHAEFVEGRIRFPLDPSRDLRARLFTLHKKGVVASHRVRQLAWSHETSVHVTTDVEVAPARFVCSHTRCRDFSFGRASPMDLAEQLSIKHAMLLVDAWYHGDIEPVSWVDLYSLFVRLGAPVIPQGPSLKVDVRSGRLRRASL